MRSTSRCAASWSCLIVLAVPDCDGGGLGVGGYTPNKLLGKPWSQVSTLLSPELCLFFVAHGGQHSYCSSMFIEYS